MPTLRWGADAPADAAAARVRLVEAAERCFERFGVSKTTVEDIATAAAVSRATVYRYFEGGRDQIVLEVLLRESQRLSDEVTAIIRRHDTVGAAIGDGLTYLVGAIRSNPTLHTIFELDAGGLTAAAITASPDFREVGQPVIAPFFHALAELSDYRRDVDVDQAAEWLIRVLVSFVTTPTSRPETELREVFRAFAAPPFAASR